MVRWVLLALGIASIGLYVLLPAGLGVVAVWPARAAAEPLPEGFAAARIETGEGRTLAAWYRPAENGVAIVVLHGAGGTRASAREHAEFLAASGYGVLAIDLRGHGESVGKTNRLGWQGTADVRAAVAFLKAQGVGRVGGLGLSMGGEILLGAAAEIRELEAIVADGATRRSLADLLALPSERPLYRNFTARVMYGTVALLSRDQEPTPLMESMLAARTTRFLLIAAGRNELEVRFNELYASALGPRGALWVVPDAEHTQALARHPQEYEVRVLRFLAGVFASPS